MIDIIVTATLRPEIHKEVFESLLKHIKTSHELKLILNIDNKGLNGINQNDILVNARRYFDNIVYNITDEPDFFNALRWCWNTTNTEFTLQWEDDWVFVNDFYIDEIIDVMVEKNIDLFELYASPKRRKKIREEKNVSYN